MLNFKLAEVKTSDPKGRWFIEYYYLNPVTKQYQRFKESCGFNREKDLAKRAKKFNDHKISINRKLLGGWNPLAERVPGFDMANNCISVLEGVILTKQAFQKESSARSTKTHLKGFIKFLQKNDFGMLPITHIDKQHIAHFVNYLSQKGLKNRTRNNYLVDVKAAFNYLKEQEGIIDIDPTKTIKFVPTRSESHTAYTETEFGKIKDWLNVNDEQMKLFCKFIIYELFRIQEILDLQVRHFDLEARNIHMPAEFIKQGRPQKKPILSLFWPDIEKLNLKEYPADYYIFSRNGKPGKHRLTDRWIRYRFNKLKTEFGFGGEYSMYGLRHTMVSSLILNGVDRFDIMQLGGWTTIESFEKYLRSTNAIPAKDYSSKVSLQL